MGDPRAGDEIRLGRARCSSRRSSVATRRRACAVRPRAGIAGGCRWLFSASVAAGAAGLWIWTRPVTFQIGEARQGQLGDVIEAADGRTIPVSFSEGSTLSVLHGGRIRVLSVKPGDVRVLVEDGVVDASIAHRQAAARRGGNSRWARIM